ncbi:MAG: hypothetical protein GPJ51_08405 [Candidatus Heimdallarchaeota archaeon]|nr:hypothetical protein [Candidatus Heimdallarchaeota archaeon]
MKYAKKRMIYSIVLIIVFLTSTNFTFSSSTNNIVETYDEIDTSISYDSDDYLHAAPEPSIIQLSNTFGGESYTKILIQDSYAYLRNSSGILIVDISDLENPALAGYFIDSSIKDYCVEGSYAYLACGTSGTKIADISDPTNVTVVGSYNYDYGDNNGVSVQIAVKDSYVFVADSVDGLEVLSAVDPTNPVGVYRHFGFGHYVNSIYVYGSYAFVGLKDRFISYDYEFYLIDISDPYSLKYRSEFTVPSTISEICARGSTLYVQIGGEFRIYDFSSDSLAQIYLDDSWGQIRSIDVSGAYAYMHRSSSDFELFDVSIPSAPNTAFAYENITAVDLIYEDSYLYAVSNGLAIYQVDFYDTENPEIVSFGHIHPISSADKASIYCAVTDDTAVGVTNLHYRTNGGDWKVASMSTLDGLNFERSFGYLWEGDIIEYFIVAEDSTGMKWDTEDNGGTYYSFVIEETDKPNFTYFDQDPNLVYADEVVTISCSVTDETGIHQVLLHYSVNNVSVTPIVMTHTTGSTYTAEFGPFEADSEISYYISAQDSTVHGNYAESSVANFTVGASTKTSYVFGIGLFVIVGLAYIYKRKR